jgi:hypothetical protein
VPELPVENAGCIGSLPTTFITCAPYGVRMGRINVRAPDGLVDRIDEIAEDDPLFDTRTDAVLYMLRRGAQREEMDND